MPTSLHILAPGTAGGLESVVRMLTAGLVEAGARVHAHLIVEPGETPELAEQLAQVGVGVHTTGVPHRRYGVERAATRDLCQRLDVDVVHCHGYRPDVIDARAARLAGLPVVSTVHGFTGGGWKNAIYEWLQFRALRRMDRVLAVSRPLFDEMGRRGVPESRVSLVPNAYAAVGETLSRADARARLGLDPEGFHVGWIGRMSHEKGPDVFVEAAAKAPAAAGLSWVMIGDGPLLEAVRAQAGSLFVDDRVRFAGLVPEAAFLVKAFDVLVLSSRTEGTPIVALEAMAAGVPVVATRVGGVPDLLADGAGVLVPSEASQALADAVDALRRHPDRAREVTRRALDEVTRQYAVGPWVRAHEEIYREVVASHRA